MTREETIVIWHGDSDTEVTRVKGAIEDNPRYVLVEEDIAGPYDPLYMSPLATDPTSTVGNYRYRTTITYRIVPRQSPSQHPKTFTPGRASRAKTLGDTNEFISAFWVNGKPKCRSGYRYDFSRKMCRLIK